MKRPEQESIAMREWKAACKIYKHRLATLHTMTADQCTKLASENNLTEGEARMLLEQEIRVSLWRAAADEAVGKPRQSLKWTRIETTGWRERCETWGRLSVNTALQERIRSVSTRIADHDRAKQTARVEADGDNPNMERW